MDPVRITNQQKPLQQQSVTVSLATDLAALSDRADKLLETYHQELFALDLDVSFNRATLATKYWLPLPESDETTYRRRAHEDGYSRDESKGDLYTMLRACQRDLRRCEAAVQSKAHKTLPHAITLFAQSVHTMSRIIDARRQSSDSDSDSDSDSSRPGSKARYARDAGKAGPNPQSHGQTPPQNFIDNDIPRRLMPPARSAQQPSSKTQTHGPTESDIRKRPPSSAQDDDGVSSSSRGSQAQLSPPKPQNEDTSESPYSKYPMRLYKSTETSTENIPSAPPSSAYTRSAGYFSSYGRDGYASRKSATRSSPFRPLPTMYGHTTDKVDAERKEYIPKDIDPSGETKVSKEGRPLEGRVFRCQTFSLPDRGKTLFMLSKDCARILGYPGSDSLFNMNRSLLRIILVQIEKEHLIRRGVIPASDISQQVVVVTARSMFRQFGASVIYNGRHVRDDYWEAVARQQGFTEEDAAGEKRPGAAESNQINEGRNEVGPFFWF